MNKPPKTGGLFKKPFPSLDEKSGQDNKPEERDMGQKTPVLPPDPPQGMSAHDAVQKLNIPKSVSLPDLNNQPSNGQIDVSDLGTAQVPSIPAPTAMPTPPNSSRKSGSLFMTGGLNMPPPATPHKTGGLSAAAPSTQSNNQTNTPSLSGMGYGLTPTSNQSNMPSLSGMGYGLTPTNNQSNMPSLSGMGYGLTPASNQSNMPTPSNMGYKPAPAVTTTIQAPYQPSTTPASTPASTHRSPRPKEFLKKTRARYHSLPKRSKVILAILAVCMLFPTTIFLLEAANIFTIYSQARSGIQHITNVKNLFTGTGGHASNLLDVNKLNQAQQELAAAHSDFLQLSNNLDQDGLLGLTSTLFPRQIQTIRALSHIGANATDIGVHLMGTGKTLAPIFRDPITKASNKPLITQHVMDIIKANIDYLLPALDRMIPYTHNLDLGLLPISDQQKQLVSSLLPLLPQARSDLAQSENFMGAISWIIGVDKPRTFLVQTMDRAELRAGGGFTGQFGTLNLNGGRMAPFNLQNIGPIEEHNPTAVTNGNRPPAPFTWWPIGNFGLRDSNLSADLPTSAQISTALAKLEFHDNIDGVIVFSPFLISHVLEITGPITIPKYNETISAQNLEARLHYYQLNNTGIYKEEVVEHVQDADIARKLFTKALANILIQHVLKAPPDELLNLAKEMLYATQTKDLQIYVTNNQIEQLLAKYGSTSQIDTSQDHDGLFVVQSNVSVSKASQYIQTSIQDTVTLDANGGATHVMNMRLAYTMQGSVYGWDYYRDYVRVYVSPNSQLLSGNGFDAHYQPYCGSLSGHRPCQTDVYGDGTLICPPNVDAGDGVSILDSPHPLGDQPVDQVGPPTNTTSDMPGRAMYGGWVNIPKNCTMNVSLSWYIPSLGHHAYSLMFQRQSSTFPQVDLTILPTSSDCTKLNITGLHFSGVMSGADTLFTPLQLQEGSSCYPNTQT